MHLDFAYRDKAGTLVLTGWSPERGERLSAVFEHGADGRRLPLHVIARFVRPDLGPEALGVLAVVTGLPAHIGTDEDLALLGPGDLCTLLYPRNLVGGDEALIASALDATVEAVLRAIGQGRIGPLSQPAAARMAVRARATARRLPQEGTRLAAAIDRAILGPGGLGLATGWVLGDAPVEDPLLGFVLDGDSIAPLGIIPGSMARRDLASFAHRYHVGGQDGFVAAFRLPPAEADRHASLLVLAANPSVGAGLMIRHVDPVGDAVAAEAVMVMLSQMATTRTRAALLDAVAGGPDAARPGAAQAMPDLPVGADCAIGGGSLVLIAADCEPEELRDILRFLLPDLARPVEVRLIGEATPPAAAAALAALEVEAATEDGRGISLGPALTRAGLMALSPGPGVEVVHGTAAALFQLGLAAPEAGRATALIHDPLAGLPGTEAPLPVVALARHPFTLRLPGALFAAAMAGAPDAALTAEGLIAAAMRPLEAAGRIGVTRGGRPSFWPGTRGTQASAALDLALAEREEARAPGPAVRSAVRS